ncbi:MAG: O-antigen ligase family protein [Deinococcales bacterium]
MLALLALSFIPLGLKAWRHFVTLALSLTLGLITIWQSGSRNALIVFALAALIIIAWRLKGRLRLVFYALSLLATLAAFYFGLGGRLQNDPLVEVPRPAIWQCAFQAFQEHPWLGLRESFGDYWLERCQTEKHQEASIQHAHNFFLAFASSYGILGLLAALIWILGLWFAAKDRYGRLLVIAALALNIYDFSLIFLWVLLPLILVLNAKRQDRSDQLSYV